MAEYEAGMTFDQAALHSTLDSVQQPEVICPLCQRYEVYFSYAPLVKLIMVSF